MHAIGVRASHDLCVRALHQRRGIHYLNSPNFRSQTLNYLLPMAGRIPTPIPTARGVRSAADPVLSESIDRSVRIPVLKLPQHVAARNEPDEISYSSLVVKESESVRGLLRSLRGFGAVRINNHGIQTEELRFALANCDRIFTLDCCTSYGDHEQIDWGGGDDRRIAQEAAAAIGKQNYLVLRQKMDDASIKLEAIAKELGNVIAQSGRRQHQETIQFEESKFTIYRYHRANVIDPNSSNYNEEASQESVPYALSLHLFLEPTEFCLDSGSGLFSFETKPESLVVTTGKELEEWSIGEVKTAQGKFMIKPFLHAGKASFSLQRKFTVSKLKEDKVISLWHQVLFILIIALLYKPLCYIFS